MARLLELLGVYARHRGEWISAVSEDSYFWELGELIATGSSNG